jgi:hypothetical protein
MCQVKADIAGFFSRSLVMGNELQYRVELLIWKALRGQVPSPQLGIFDIQYMFGVSECVRCRPLIV